MGYIVWLWLSFEKPSKHPSISDEEKLYIEESLGDSHDRSPTVMTIPWIKMMTSPAVWAIMVANFAKTWTFTLYVIALPKYFKEVFEMNVDSGSSLAALPQLFMALFVLLGGHLSDLALKKEVLSVGHVRKLFNCGGYGGEAVFLLVVGYTRSKIVAMIALTAAAASSGFGFSGYCVNDLDIAPRYAAILSGITNGFGLVAGLICPIMTELMAKDYNMGEESLVKWQNVLIVSACVNIFDMVFFAIFASGEIQDWAKVSQEDASIILPEMEEISDIDHATFLGPSNYGTVENTKNNN